MNSKLAQIVLHGLAFVGALNIYKEYKILQIKVPADPSSLKNVFGSKQ